MRSPHHLEPAADPEDHRWQVARTCAGRRAPRRGRWRAQPAQVVDRGACAGDDDEIGVAQGRHAGATQRTETPGSATSGSRSVKLARRGRRSTATSSVGRHERAACPEGPLPAPERILGVEREVAEVRQHAEGGDAAARLELGGAGPEEGGVAAEAVDHEAADQGGEVGRQEGDGAVEVGEDAAALDVGDEHGRDGGAAGEAEVHDVVGEEVDLGGAAGTLAHDDVEAGAQVGERGVDDVDERVLGVAVRGGVLHGERAAHQHDLRGAFGCGLEEDRVHGDLGLGAGGDGLEPLGPAYLAAAGRDHGVQRHVLALERRHRDAVAGEQAAQAGDDGGLAGVGRRATHHERAARGYGHRASSSPRRGGGETT